MIVLRLASAVIFSLSVSADVFPFRNSQEYQDGHMGNYPAQTFVSQPEIIAPVANIIVDAQEGVSSEQYITWAPTGPFVPPMGPQLLDTDTLSLAFQAPLFGPDNFGLSVQSCNDTDYLVWWSGNRTQWRSAGTWHVFNANYESVWNISAVGLDFADAHDLFLTPECTAVITVFQPKEYNLTALGIEEGWIMESYIQEIEPVTNTLLFEWQASDHVNINDTLWTSTIRGYLTNTSEESWDFFHINSIEKDHKGNYLISSRHMSSLYYIDGKSGDILWTLGGQANDFTDLSGGRASDFRWQHQARWTSPDLTSISVFDDANCRFVKSDDPVSRGMVLQLDVEAMTVMLVKEFKAPSDIQSFRKGGMHYLANGNALLGYGNEPGFSEFSPDGRIIWDVRFGPLGRDRDTADNYRSMKVNWTGTPSWAPKIAAGSAFRGSFVPLDDSPFPYDPNDTAYFSWNGATKLEKWIVLTSNESPNLTSIAQQWSELPKLGFETSVQVGNAARYVRAIAVSASNEILAASPVLDMHDGSTIEVVWSTIDFTTQRTDTQGYEDDIGLVAQYNALKEDWKTSKATTKSILVAALCGGLFAIVVLVVALSWRCRAICAGSALRNKQRGYQAAATAEDFEDFDIGAMDRSRDRTDSFGMMEAKEILLDPDPLHDVDMDSKSLSRQNSS